ncbi:MAG: hypothetical protein FD167_6001, partial [bacterium]
QLIYKHSEIPPIPLQKKCREIPTAIAEVVMTALAKNPTDRFPSAKVFATALRANLEGDIPLLHHSFSIYWKHFIQIVRISLPINFAFVLIISLISTSLIQTKFDFAIGSFIHLVWWILPLIALLLFGEVSIGAFSLATKQLQETGAISVNKVLASLVKRLPQIIGSALHSYLLALSQVWKLLLPAFRLGVQYSLSSPIAVLENKKGSEIIIERSKDLTTEFYSIAVPLKLRSLLVKSITFALILSTFMANASLFSNLELNFLSRFTTIAFTTLLLPGLFITIVNPLVDIAIVLLYFRACEAKGESVYQQKGLDEIEFVEKIKFSPKRKAILVFLLVT